MRGSGNSTISCYERWKLKGKNIRCQGNIENLLDYKSVINNVHPPMYDSCFAGMFLACHDLIEAPQLPSMHLSTKCYHTMFAGCNALQQAPCLKAINLASECYRSMFSHCSSLTDVPYIASPYITYEACYKQMFMECVSLVKVPQFLIGTLSSDCCYRMFNGCAKLERTPTFASGTIAKEAIMEQDVFRRCSSVKFVNINNKLYDINVLKLF